MYALFSQQKLVYQGLLGSAQSELMNITHQHENLALRDTGLKSALASIQQNIGSQKSELYDELSQTISDSDYKILTAFAAIGLTDDDIELIRQNKYTNPLSEDKTDYDLIDKGLKITSHSRTAGDTTNDIGTNLQKFTKIEWLCKSYGMELENFSDRLQYVRSREEIENELTQLDNDLAVDEARINKQIDEVALKETRLDTEKASIETKITDYQKQLEKIEEAEGKGIEASIGKFQGVG